MVKIKRLIKYMGVSSGNKEPKNLTKSYVQEFDERQNCTKEIEYNSEGEVENASGFTFNPQNKMVEEIHYFSDDEIGEHVRYIHDDQGRLIEVETTYADDAKSIKKIKRNERQVIAQTFDEDGDLEAEEKVIFNTDGKPLEEIQYDENGNIVQRSVFEYDAAGNVIARINYGDHNEFQMKSLFEYDKSNNLVNLQQLNIKDELITSLHFEYDNDSRQVFQQNSRQQIHTEYDSHGRVIVEETKNRANNMVEKLVEYKYGDHGLVIEERMFSMGDAYQLEPGVFSRTASSFLVTRFEYEFYEN